MTSNLENRILLENYCLTRALEQAVDDFLHYYTHHHYHKSIRNLTSADVYIGRNEHILKERKTLKQRRLLDIGRAA